MVVPPFYYSMKEATHPSTDSTFKMSEYLASYEDSVPRWKARRLAIAMSHSDTISTKTLLEQ